MEGRAWVKTGVGTQNQITSKKQEGDLKNAENRHAFYRETDLPQYWAKSQPESRERRKKERESLGRRLPMGGAAFE